LYGDHFTLEQIQAWFEDEANAYFEMGGGSQEPDKYGYAELNRQLFYARLPAGRRFGMHLDSVRVTAPNSFRSLIASSS